jgi:hypothetical protein
MRWYQIRYNKNIFYVLIITSLVLGFFLPICFAQNVEPLDTVGPLEVIVGPEMSIYENSDNNFKLSYPQDWYAREPDPNSFGIVYGFLPPEEDIINPKDYVIIQVELLPLQTTLDQYTQSLIRQIKNDSANVRIISAKTATMGINPAGELVYTLQEEGNSFKILKIFAVKDNKAYIITYNALIDNYDRLLSAARDIVGSFVFTGTRKQERTPVYLTMRNETGPEKEPIVGPTVVAEGMSEGQIVSQRTDDIEEYLRSLEDKNASVRAEAAKALGLFNDARAIEPLIQSIRDTDSKVRFEAERALGIMGSPAIVPLLLVLDDNDRDFRSGVAYALGKIGVPAVDSLILALKDDK